MGDVVGIGGAVVGSTGGGGGSIETIESTDGSVTVTNPNGPTVDLTGAGGGASGSVPYITGLVGDSGTTDNWATITNAITALTGAGIYTARIASASGWYGVAQDLAIPANFNLLLDGRLYGHFGGAVGGTPPANGSWRGAGIGPVPGSTYTRAIVTLGGNASIQGGTVIATDTAGTVYPCGLVALPPGGQCIQDMLIVGGQNALHIDQGAGQGKLLNTFTDGVYASGSLYSTPTVVGWTPGTATWTGTTGQTLGATNNLILTGQAGTIFGVLGLTTPGAGTIQASDGIHNFTFTGYDSGTNKLTGMVFTGSLTATLTHGAAVTVNSTVTVGVSSIAGIAQGQPVHNASRPLSIPTGTYVVSVDAVNTRVVLSASPTSNIATGDLLVFVSGATGYICDGDWEVSNVQSFNGTFGNCGGDNQYDNCHFSTSGSTTTHNFLMDAGSNSTDNFTSTTFDGRQQTAGHILRIRGGIYLGSGVRLQVGGTPTGAFPVVQDLCVDNTGEYTTISGVKMPPLNSFGFSTLIDYNNTLNGISNGATVVANPLDRIENVDAETGSFNAGWSLSLGATFAGSAHNNRYGGVLEAEVNGFLAGPLTGAVTTPSAGSDVTSLVPQYTSEQQDAQSLGGTAGAGSIATGVGFSTTVAAASNGVSLTTLAGGTALSVAAIGGPLSANFYALGTQTIEIETSGGLATLSYTGKTGTPGSAGTITGIAIVSGTGSWTVGTGGGVYEQPLIIPDIIGPAASIGRGDGGVLGVSDWATLLSNTENDLAGLIPQLSGFVMPVYSDTLYGGLQWATNSGAGVSTVTTGSPSVTANAGAGGALASSVLLGATGAVAADTRSFRRLMLFFQKQTNGATVTIATTGVVKTSGSISTAGSGLAVWDSGDIGYQSAGTGFAATAGSVAGSGATSAGVVLVGALYIQSSGVNGVINVNVAKGGTYTGDWASTLTGFQAFVELLVTMGMVPRRFMTGDEISNDQLNGVAVATAAANLATIATGLTAASPLTQIVMSVPYYLGTVALPGVGVANWPTWVAAMRSAAVTASATFLDLYAAFGNVSAAGGDPLGYTIDNLHFSVPPAIGSSLASHSGRNGQETLAEFFFNKLATSKDYAVSGTTQSGTAVDGSVTTLLGQGLSGTRTGPVTQWKRNASDTQPALIVGTPFSQLGAAAILAGPGGTTAPDTILLRLTAGVWRPGNATGAVAGTGITMAGLGLGTTVPSAAGTRATLPPTQATINTALGQIAVGTALQNTLSYDVRAVIHVPVTASTTGTLLIGVGTTNTPTQVTVVASSALTGIITIPVTIPAGQYVLLSKGGTSTLGTPVTYWEAA